MVINKLRTKPKARLKENSEFYEMTHAGLKCQLDLTKKNQNYLSGTHNKKRTNIKVCMHV